MILLSPASLLLICWGVTVGVAVWALGDPVRFDLVPVFMAREYLDPRALGPIGALWMATALAVYLIGDLACRVTLPQRRRFAPAMNLDRAAFVTFAASTAFLAITLAWVATSGLSGGGMDGMVQTVVTENRAARDMLLENKLFAGMRLFYAALPATGCMAAAILAAGRGRLSRRSRFLCRIVLVATTVALFVLPIVMSQRLLLLQFVLSAWIATCVIRGRPVGLVRIVIGAGLFLAVWMLRESLTNPTIDRAASDIGLQKLAFFFVNDLWNSLAPLDADFAHTLGVFSLKGLMFITFTDGYITTILADRIDGVAVLRGGGEFSLLTAPFVDFGIFGGVAFIAVLAFLFRLAFHFGRQSLGWAVIYGQIGATLLYSSHSLYATHQNFLVSLVVIAVIARLSRRRVVGRATVLMPHPVARAAPPPIPLILPRSDPPQEVPARAA